MTGFPGSAKYPKRTALSSGNIYRYGRGRPPCACPYCTTGLWALACQRPGASVSAATWRRAAAAVPEASAVAGTFAAGSGPNCFGTVMAAAGVVEARSTWMLQEPFSEWLAERAEPVRGTSQDAVPGTVLVWHENDQLAHAAITIGDGWALSKPSQSWSSPTMVWTVSESITSWRLPGTRLSRHRLKR